MAHRSSVPESSPELTAEHVCRLTIDLLGEHLPLALHDSRSADADIVPVMVVAAAQGRSVTSVCQQVTEAPSANLVH